MSNKGGKIYSTKRSKAIGDFWRSVMQSAIPESEFSGITKQSKPIAKVMEGWYQDKRFIDEQEHRAKHNEYQDLGVLRKG